MDTGISLHAAPGGASAALRTSEVVAPAGAVPASGVVAAPHAAATGDAVDAAALARDLQLGVKPSERALAQLNDFLKSQQQQLEFSMDKATRRIVLRVIDTSSGQVIRQVPSEDWLHLAQTLASGGSGGALIQDQA